MSHVSPFSAFSSSFLQRPVPAVPHPGLISDRKWEIPIKRYSGSDWTAPHQPVAASLFGTPQGSLVLQPHLLDLIFANDHCISQSRLGRLVSPSIFPSWENGDQSGKSPCKLPVPLFRSSWSLPRRRLSSPVIALRHVSSSSPSWLDQGLWADDQTRD